MPGAQDSAIRVRLKYPDLETFVDRFAPNVTRGGVFLVSRDPRPVGNVIRFELWLGHSLRVLSGEGKVTWVKAWNPAEPQRTHGMGVQFLYVDPDTRANLENLLERKAVARRPSSPDLSTPGLRFGGTPAAGVAVDPATPESIEEWAEETALQRALERARTLSSRPDNLDDLLIPDTAQPATLDQALAELPRLISPRRNTGALRLLPDTALASPTGTGEPAKRKED